MGEALPHLNIAPDAGLIRYFTAHSAGRLANAPEAFIQYAEDIQVTALAINIAIPLTRLKTPNAVPRRLAGAVSATIVANNPCVIPICRPHSATPARTVVQ